MHNVAIHCCHGYFFKEFYCPLIKQIKDRFNVYLFIENSFLSKEVIDLANELLRKGFIKSYKITKLYPYIDRYKFTDIVYLLRCHFRYNRFISQLFSKKIYYYILAEDRTVFSRILISKINRRNGKAILVIPSTPGDFFYEHFRKNKKK